MIPSRTRWFAALGALGALVLVACGGDDGGSGGEDAGGVEVTPAGRVELEVPAQLEPGDTLTVSWTAIDPPEGARIALRLREPGAPVTGSSAGYFAPGSAPAEGPRWWIDADGGAIADGEPIDDLVAIADPADDGQVEIVLPSDAEGDWAVDALLLDAAGAPIHVASGTAWVAGGPALRLAMSRTWLGPDDLVRADVELRGAEVEPLRLSAWLTTPDGTVLSLPDLVPTYRPVAEGALTSGPIELFGGQLGRYGEGEYRVALKLETLEGVRVAAAAATVQACSAPGTLAGLVASADGTALGDGRVTAIDTDYDRAFEGTVDADGNYTVEVPAGRYVVLASGADWNAGEASVEVGCGATTTTAVRGVVDPVPASAAIRERLARPVRVAASVPPPIQLRVKIAQSVETTDAGVIAGMPRFSRLLTTGLRERTGTALTYYEERDVVLAGLSAFIEQSEGLDSTAATSAMIDMMSTDFIIQLRVIPLGGKYRISAIVLDDRTETIVFAVDHTADNLTDPVMMAALDAVAGRLAAAAGQSPSPLVPLLLSRRIRPINPVLDLRLSTGNAGAGEVVTARLTLYEASPRSPVDEKTVAIRVTLLDGTEIAAYAGPTDATGTITFPFTVPAAPAFTYLVRGELERGGGVPIFRSSALGLNILPTGFTGLATAAKGTLTSGERAEVRVVTSGLAPYVQLSAVNGQPDTATGTSNGVVGFIAGVIEGPAKLIVTFFTNGLPAQFFAGSFAIPVPVPFYVVSPLGLTAFADPNPSIVNNAYVQIRGVVTKQGAGVPGAKIAFTTVGGGGIAQGVTANADGAYAAIFRSPSTGGGVTTITVTTVVDTQVLRRTVQIAWGPQCSDCPVLIDPDSSREQMLAMHHGETQLFSANQQVTWQVTGDGSITSQGLFTAGTTGGTVLIRATSVQNAANFATARVVQDCTLDEVVGTGLFAGSWTVITALSPFNCSTAARATIASTYVEASVDCTPNPSPTLWVWWSPTPPMNSTFCSIGATGVGPPGPCPAFGGIGPDPDQPGMLHRRMDAHTRRTEADGSCTTLFEGSAILTAVPQPQ